MSTIFKTLSQALRRCPAGHAAQSVQHPQMHIQSISEYFAERLLGRHGWSSAGHGALSMSSGITAPDGCGHQDQPAVHMPGDKVSACHLGLHVVDGSVAEQHHLDVSKHSTVAPRDDARNRQSSGASQTSASYCH